MELLAESLGVRHRFCAVYIPWPIGTEERYVSNFYWYKGNSAKSEIKEPECNKPIPAFHSVINGSSARLFGNRLSVTVLGDMPSSNLLKFALSVIRKKEVSSAEEAGSSHLLAIVNLEDTPVKCKTEYRIS